MSTRWIAVVLVLALSSATGCLGIRPTALSDLLASGVDPKLAEEHRTKFQETRSEADLRWLLAHCITTGMTPAEVGHVLGEDGRRVYDDGWVKNNGGSFQAGDETWKWAADREGHSLMLVFRENRLIGFDPDEFRD